MLKHKFNAVRTEVDGIKFSSKKEAKHYSELQIAKRSGDLLFCLRQVPFHLPGDVVYRADFLEFWRDGTVRIVDVKGFETQMFRAKRKIVEATYPIKITVV